MSAADETPSEIPVTTQVPVELTMVTMAFDAADQAALGAVLSQYVVVSRREPGCRNIDLCV